MRQCNQTKVTLHGHYYFSQLSYGSISIHNAPFQTNAGIILGNISQTMLHIDTCFKPISLTNSIMPNIFSALTIPKPEILRELRLFKPASAAQEFSNNISVWNSPT
jgi:hypothetical protein|tara:strand:+ start:338 stop:655 length:318 start_codon:yes stop_codon:yes gene_type:complete